MLFYYKGYDMILDDIASYDIGHHLGINLSHFSKGITLFSISFLIVFSLLAYFVFCSERKRVINANNKKELLAQQEIAKYKQDGMLRFNQFNSEDAQLKDVVKDLNSISSVIEGFISEKQNIPEYIDIVTKSQNALRQYELSKNTLFSSLNNGEEVNIQHPIFMNYKTSVLNINNIYVDILRLNISKPDTSTIDIDDI